MSGTGQGTGQADGMFFALLYSSLPFPIRQTISIHSAVTTKPQRERLQIREKDPVLDRGNGGAGGALLDFGKSSNER